MTERLYYRNSHMREFTARVVSCVPGKHGYDVVLDRTAFYPEGGGQPGDRGTLNDVPVTDTHEIGGEVVHFCSAPLPVGEPVTGLLDWPWRFQLMQQHSGEHMVSGLIHEAYGYSNVGFHMGRDAVTIDFDGMMTPAQLAEIENQVNARIWEDLPVTDSWPDQETLQTLPYRSKKELTGPVRLVCVPGTDLCACCGVHVQRTGEIGLVKFLSMQKFHAGVRIEMLCGGRALEYLTRVWAQNREISGLLSAKPLETAAAAARMQQELNDVKFRLGQMEEQCFRSQAETFRDAGNVLLFADELRPDSLRRLADAILQTCGGRAAVFSPSENGFQYAIGEKDGDLRAFTKEMNQALQGRGGGKPGFVQGSVKAGHQEIEAFLEARHDSGHLSPCVPE